MRAANATIFPFFNYVAIYKNSSAMQITTTKDKE